MRGNTAGFGSIEVLVRALLDEFPELDARWVRAAVERATAKVAHAALDTEGHRFVDHHLARVEASEDSVERARILRDLATNLADRRDAERALVVRRAAVSEAADPDDVDALLRLAGITQRWSDLPLDAMAALIDPTDDASPRPVSAIAPAREELGLGYRAAGGLARAGSPRARAGDRAGRCGGSRGARAVLSQPGRVVAADRSAEPAHGARRRSRARRAVPRARAALRARARRRCRRARCVSRGRPARARPPRRGRCGGGARAARGRLGRSGALDARATRPAGPRSGAARDGVLPR